MENIEILKNVLLLAISNKKKEDSIQDVFIELDEINAMSLKESKNIFKDMKKEKLFFEGDFTLLGLQKVEEANVFFKL